MISNATLQRTLENIADVSINATPSHVTRDTPDFWTLHLKSVGERWVYMGILHNEGHFNQKKPQGDAPYALMRRPNPETCDVTQEDYDRVIATLRDPTSDRVHYEDGTKIVL